MKQRVILDTGPLVAFINRREQFHNWARQELAKIDPPLLTCEPVLTEACFLLQRVHGGEETIISYLDNKIIKIDFNLSEEVTAIGELMRRYHSVPMSLADACLVRMAELFNSSSLLTLDRDFRIYRKNRNEPLDLIIAERF